MEAVAFAAITTTMMVVVAVVVATIVVAAVVVIVAMAIGVIVVGVGELACWTMFEEVTFPAGFGPCPCPLPAFGDIDPSLGSAPSLQRTKE